MIDDFYINETVREFQTQETCDKVLRYTAFLNGFCILEAVCHVKKILICI